MTLKSDILNLIMLRKTNNIVDPISLINRIMVGFQVGKLGLLLILTKILNIFL